MIEVDVEHAGDRGRQTGDGAVRLVALGDADIAAAATGVRPELQDLATDHERRVEVETFEGERDHRGGRRLAVGSRDDDARAVILEDLREHIGPVQDRDAALPGSRELGLAGGNGRRDHHPGRVVGVPDVVGSLAGDTEGAKRRERARFDAVAAADRDPARGQDPGQSAHADAADADEVRRHRERTSPRTSSAMSSTACGRARLLIAARIDA